MALRTLQEPQAATVGFADLPSVASPPEGAVVSRPVLRARARLARREFLRVAGGALLGTGLAFAGLFPTARVAWAGHKVSCWTQSQYCTNPSGSHAACGASGRSISSTYCASSGWHRHDNAGGGVSYWLRQECGNSSKGYRYAWIWKHNGTNWRCSDGFRRKCSVNLGTCAAPTRTVCPASGKTCS